ncbi:MAG: hypothetical protein HY094_02610 [Candidatus Melainabacteria bacterium]|nr:hypothetical protein [Candidatus Melainabacteria bacterium]
MTKKLKEEFEDKLQTRLDEEAKKREEFIQKTSETKEEIIQSIQSIKGALKKEFEDNLQTRLDEEAKKREESIQKTSETKEEIIQSIQSVKVELKKELIQSLKEELKKELTEEITEEEEEILDEALININNDLKCKGSMFLNLKGDVLVENWDRQISHEEIDSTIIQVFNTVNQETNETNQGSLLHILLESEDGTLALANIENKILTVYTNGTGELFSGQILRTLSEIEE